MQGLIINDIIVKLTCVIIAAWDVPFVPLHTVVEAAIPSFTLFSTDIRPPTIHSRMPLHLAARVSFVRKKNETKHMNIGPSSHLCLLCKRSAELQFQGEAIGSAGGIGDSPLS